MSETKSKAVEIIRDYMGESTAQAYAGFYATQDDAMVLASVRELMREYVGAGQADEIFRKNGLGQ